MLAMWQLALWGCLFISISFAKDNTGIEDIAKAIEEHQVKTVDELIDVLPESLRESYMLIYDTKNKLQYASYEEPRVALFNERGFALTFTGKEDSPGGHTVEMMEFDPDENTYRLASIDFNEGATINHNPPKCMGCHMGIRSRKLVPKVDSYPFWRGWYGSTHPSVQHSPEYEQKKYEAFKKDSATKNRYRFLSNIALNSHDHMSEMIRNFNLHSSNYTTQMLVNDFIAHPRHREYMPVLYAILDVPNMSEKLNSQSINPSAFNFINLLPTMEGVDHINSFKDHFLNHMQNLRLATTYNAQNMAAMNAGVVKQGLEFDGIHRLSSLVNPFDIASSLRYAAISYVLKHLGIEMRDYSTSLLKTSVTDTSPDQGMSMKFLATTLNYFSYEPKAEYLRSKNVDIKKRNSSYSDVFRFVSGIDGSKAAYELIGLPPEKQIEHHKLADEISRIFSMELDKMDSIYGRENDCLIIVESVLKTF